MAWRVIDAEDMNGILIRGSPEPKTRNLIEWLSVKLWGCDLLDWVSIKIWGFKAIQLFTVSEVPKEGYCVGYRPKKGPARVLTERVMTTTFAVRIGKASRTFFAMDGEGKEITIFRAEMTTLV